MSQIQEVIALLNNLSRSSESDTESAWVVGKCYLIRTVTMTLTGRLRSVSSQELTLNDAAWIADTGRFSDAIRTGKLEEVEPYGDKPVIVGRGSIVDATEWVHPLPREQK